MELGTSQRIQGLLKGILDEIPVQDQPLNYDYNYICSTLKMHNPDKREFIFAMSQLGYNAVQTYYNSDNWKTDAPPEVIYDVLRAYKYDQCSGDQEKMMLNIKENSAGHRILSKKSEIEGKLDFNWKAAVEKLEEQKKEG